MGLAKVTLGTIYTVDMLVKSRLVRHYTVGFLAGAAVTTLIGQRNEDGTLNESWGNAIRCLVIAGIATYATNNALDTILERKDIKNLETYERRMKELEWKYPTAR